MIYKNEKKNNYTILSNEIWTNIELSLKAKGLYCYLLTLPTDWKIHIIEIKHHFKEGIRSIREAIKELEQHGYLKKNIIRQKGKIFKIDYDVFESPALNLEKGGEDKC